MAVPSPSMALAARSAGMNQRYGLGRFRPGIPDAPNAPGMAGTPAPGSDPYAGIIGSLPRPMTNQQITQQASGEISPLVAAVTKQITGQTQAATNAIGGFSADAANKLAALDFGAPYQGAEAGQAAVDAALRQSLAGAGSSDANALASRLAAINDPTVAAAANTLSANGEANGNTQLAQGSAALSNLIANAAAAKDYGLQQPGIQKLAGLQQIAAAEQAGTANIGTQTQQLESQLPSIIQSLASQNDNRSAALTAARENQIARNDALAATQARNATSVKVANARGAASVKVATIKAGEQTTKDARPNAALSKTVGYVVDSSGQWIPGADGKPQLLPGYTTNAQGQVVKVGKTGSTTAKPPTANEINSWVDAFKNGKPTTVTVKLPKPDANGNPVYRTVRRSTGKLSYLQAYKRLTAAGIGDVQARQYLDTAYKRGEQGRAWLSNEEQAALSAAKLAPQAHRYKGVAYLDRTQAQALTAAKRMPPGHWIQGSTSTKDLGPIFVIDETY